MPTVRFHYPAGSVDITKRMSTPKKIERIEKWFDDARKVIPEIPNPITDGWSFHTAVCSTELIVFQLEHPTNTQQPAFVYIDRTTPSI